MEVRALNERDLAAVVQYGIERKERTFYRGLPTSRAQVAFVFRRSLTAPDEQCFVVDDGQIRGFILLFTDTYWWADPSKGPRLVTDRAFFSNARGAGELLLRAAIEWARTLPRVVECLFDISSGRHFETATEVYRRAGCTPRGMGFGIDFRSER